MPHFQRFPWPIGASACGVLAWRAASTLCAHATLLGALSTILPRSQSPDQVAWPQYREVERPIALPELPPPRSVGADLPAPAAASKDATELAPLEDGARRLSVALAQTWTHVPVVPPLSASSPAATSVAPAPARPAATIDESTHAPIYVPASLVSGPPPTYPSRSRRAGEEGSVKLRIRVQADGSVGDVWIVEGSGFERLDSSASQAVRAWTFKPATTDGAGVPSLVIHTVTFKLDRPRN